MARPSRVCMTWRAQIKRRRWRTQSGLMGQTQSDHGERREVDEQRINRRTAERPCDRSLCTLCWSETV